MSSGPGTARRILMLGDDLTATAPQIIRAPEKSGRTLMGRNVAADISSNGDNTHSEPAGFGYVTLSCPQKSQNSNQAASREIGGPRS
jgi:hypothetical protein